MYLPAPWPREELDAALARYRRLADQYGAEAKAAIRVRNAIVERNLRLVATVVDRYRVRVGVEKDDLISFGTFGLMTATERFDLSKGFAFSTYAVWWVRHAINRGLIDTSGSLIRVPVHAHDSLARIDRGDTLQARDEVD